MLNLTRREKNVLLYLVFLYIAGSAIFFGKKVFFKVDDNLTDNRVIETNFKKLADQVDSNFFSSEFSDVKDSTETPVSLCININKATKEDLMKIKGIGSATAEKIIEYRLSNGNFNSINELTKIHGIGEKTLERIKGEVTIE
ncbi:MAG: helix-hairpin-helix domain-containing protein [Candidatus Marinimicrobia bacterium]|nr:helix-hairpin-helix domain-containing protein [Candidatus Neomarinimicrobiota bacterium]